MVKKACAHSRRVGNGFLFKVEPVLSVKEVGL